ncbi:Trk system potassium transporter TrkA [Candidatus Poribacteria bacterium]|nr:MAG: Trk system potassium transporter TrkA [Candidatus Poribacteria bacterium]
MKAIIIGAGEVGFHTAKLLTREEHDVVLIDDSEEACQRVNEQLDMQTLCGSGASPRLIKAAGIDEAELLIAVTNVDEINMLACQIASLQTDCTKIARVSNPDYFILGSELEPKDFGIDLLVNPEQLCVAEFVRLLKVPEAREIVEFEGGKVQLVSFRVRQSNPFIGVSLAELDKNGLLVDIRFAAISRRKGAGARQSPGEAAQYIIIPRGTDVLQQGDEVFVIGSALAVEQLLRLSGIMFNGHLERVIVAGASPIGIQLASALEKNDTNVKLIEANQARAELASQMLKRTTVLHGDYLQFRLLEEAGVEEVDGFVSVTGDDEDDIMACMTAKENGAQRVLALVQQPHYLPLLARIPRLDGVVSRHLAVVSNILRLIRRGQIISVASLHGINAEVLEIVAGINAKIVHKELSSFKNKFPENAFIGAVIRRERLIIPTGESVIQPADKVIVFSMPDAIPVVEDLFAERRG